MGSRRAPARRGTGLLSLTSQRRLSLAIVVCLLVAAAPADAGEIPRLERLRFEGVTEFEHDALLSRFATPRPTRWWWPPWRGEPFDEEALREDLDRIAELYRDHGFYAAQARYELELRARGSRVRVTIAVDEGEPVVLERFDCELDAGGSLPPRDRDALLDSIPLEAGRRFSSVAYREAKETVINRAHSLGYLAAKINGRAQVDPAALRAEVDWRVILGPRVEAGPVRVDGTRVLDPELVLRELRFGPGAPLTPARIKQAQRAVHATGLFRTVAIRAIEPQRDRSKTEPQATREAWPIEVVVEERKPRSVQASLGYGTEDRLRASLGWTHRNLLGRGERLRFEGRYSDLVVGLESSFTQRRFPDFDSTIGAFTHLVWESEPAYEADRLILGPWMDRSIGEHWTARGAYVLDWSKTLEAPDLPASSLDGARGFLRIARFELGLAFRDLDDALEPRRGFAFDFRVDPYSRAIGSERSFIRLTGGVRMFLPVGGATVLALKLRLGSLAPLEGDEKRDIPVYERFFSGGSTTVRGFDYQELGPQDEDGRPAGGFSLLEASAELRFPIWRDLSGVAFADTGSVGTESWRIRGSEIFFSMGAGLRYSTPIGPLRVDLAQVLDPPDGQDGLRIHFSIGHAF